MITGARIEDDRPERPYLRVYQSGCGCCESDDKHYDKDTALAALKEYEDELKESLKEVRELRAKVRKWKR